MAVKVQKIDADAVRFWLAQLTREDPALRAYAASELHLHKSRARASVAPRGALRRPAHTEGPLGAQVRDALLAALDDDSWEVRREAAAALTHWGDAAAVARLARLAFGETQDPFESVRRACLRALGNIGGEDSLRPLTAALSDPSEEVAGDAVCVLTALARHECVTSGSGKIRKIGRSNVEQEETLAALTDALDALAASDRSPYLRDLAHATLASLA